MRKISAISLSMIFLFVLVIGVTSVNAGENNPWVSTFKEDGTPSTSFGLGEKIMIKAFSEYPLPYDIIVTDPDGVVRFSDTSVTPNYEKVLPDVTDKPGWWEVKAGTEATHYASGWYHVIPETQVGIVGVLIAMFAAWGIFAVKKGNLGFLKRI